MRHFTKRSQPKYAEAHQWFHTQIGITAEQEKRLEPIEQRFTEQRKHSTEMLRIANSELEQAMADLQHAALQHIFAMKSVLAPEQYDELSKLSADALQHAEEGR